MCRTGAKRHRRTPGGDPQLGHAKRGRMILVCGVLGDAMIELMCARLNDMGCEYVFLDESRFPGEFHVSWSIRGKDLTGYVSSPSGKVNLDDITGIYVRYVH